MASISVPNIGKPLDRVDGRLKVTGAARYAAEFPVKNSAYAVLMRSHVPSGRITAFHADAAAKAPGVLGVFSHLNPLPWKDSKAFSKNEVERGSSAMSIRPLATPEMYYNGQYIAMVVAETLQQAQHAVSLVMVDYDVPTPVESLKAGQKMAAKLSFHNEIPHAETPKKIREEPTVRKSGDANQGLAQAEVKFQATYTTPWETHNPIEPHATIAMWQGDRLTVFDATQGVDNVKGMLAEAFGIPVENVRVVCKFVGGAFGCKGLAWPHVPLAAAAARAVNRPVKLAIERHDMFTNVGYRSPTIQHVELGAKRDGSLVSIIHSGLSQSAIRDTFIEPFTNPTSVMYATPNIQLSQQIVRLNVCRPTFMRAPGEVTGMYALECAIDELAHELKIDPVELRLRNDAQADPVKHLPFSSKSLKECFHLAAEKFGWAQRSPEPGSTKDGRTLIGWGVASSLYPTQRSEAEAELVLHADGSATASSATHDLGTGTYTVLSQLLAEMLGVPLHLARVDIGDTRFPKAPVSGGSQSVNSVGSALKAAVDEARGKLLSLVKADATSPLHGLSEDEVVFAKGGLYHARDAAKGESWKDILKRSQQDKLTVSGKAVPGDEKKKFIMQAFGSHFCEVRVDPELGTVRVSRWVCAHACGRVINAKTAASQIRGGVVMGIGMALMEETRMDERWGRVIIDDLADYHVPVHADIPFIESHFVEEIEEHANPIGTKGIGEIGIVGAAAAVANAVFHATGKRIRDLPLTPDKLIGNQA
jgi:xanthine dehydrogenase YagR molybdenum-binding subunit